MLDLPIKRSCFVVFILCLLLGKAPIQAKVTLPAFFSDHMVLQQNSEIRFWGWAKPREKVLVKLGWNGETFSTQANNQAHWEVRFKTPEAGGPYAIQIQGSNTLILKDVLLGEVWICSGQSNMEWTARMGIDGGQEAVANAHRPNIRFFTVDHRSALSPQIDVHGQWEVCSPESMIDFSAVAYFFAKKLQKELAVPIGIINSSWGGTPAEAWMPAAVVMANKDRAAAAAKLDTVPWGPVEAGRIYNAMISPLLSVKIAGVIWYQGESNTRNADAYEDMFSALITSWRENWGYPFPFYFAQIAPFRYGAGRLGALVRDAQRRTLKLPATGMVVTSDIGDTTDIHPRNKHDVGLRMANLALKGHYKQLETVVSGPLFDRFEVKGKKILVYFKNSEGLYAKGGDLTSFEIAGKDGKYYPAKAFIRKGKVVALSKKVRYPLAVRFAWSNTATPNLFNGANLPASCFTSE